jgi:hypothetical protein
VASSPERPRIEIIRAQRPISHRADPRRRVRLFQLGPGLSLASIPAHRRYSCTSVTCLLAEEVAPVATVCHRAVCRLVTSS